MLPPNLARDLAKGTVMSCFLFCFFGFVFSFRVGEGFAVFLILGFSPQPVFAYSVQLNPRLTELFSVIRLTKGCCWNPPMNLKNKTPEVCLFCIMV